ncbi:MAG: hypothetical protein Q8M98_05870 [Candidatus Cloacimonadaceae bacterium]|nr:hypothetical protein [Candidatus Cloacimonadaceae bacterium]
MKKFFKAVLFIGGTALAAHFGMKAYKRVSGIVKLSKSLPEFLNNVYGEKPKTNINRTFSAMNIKLGFTQEIIDKHTDIETTVREYIDDFYPELAKCSVDIEVYVKGEEEECCDEEVEPEEEEI